MPTYGYICDACGLRFERRQAITEESLTRCPECGGEVRRQISGGSGIILKGSHRDQTGHAGNHECSLEQTGSTCCGRDQRCDKPPCGG